MIEPNCDMPWDIYLDWLQDQGYEDLRDILIDSFCPCDIYMNRSIFRQFCDGNGDLLDYDCGSELVSLPINADLFIGDGFTMDIGRGDELMHWYFTL